jgi:L-arabinonolactonase
VSSRPIDSKSGINVASPIHEVRCVQQANSILGEGGVWRHDEAVLYWVDIKRPAVFRFDPTHGQTGHWPMPTPVGCVAPTRSGTQLLFADADGFGFLDLTTGQIQHIADPEGELPHNRFNDGKVDRAGRFWAGTLDDRCAEPTGSLYRLDAQGTVHRMAKGFLCANGIGWSPDNRTMYFTDSMLRTIWAYEFDFATGELGARRDFATLPDHDGLPDGLTVDSQGFVWSAIWDGWRLVRYAPDGTIDREVRMPVQRPTSCAFGGPSLKTLYVTSACDDLDSKALKRGPLAGSLFAVACDVPGLPEVPFAA